MTLISRRRTLSRARMLDFLRELAETPDTVDGSLYLPPHLPTTEAEKSLKEAITQQDTAEKLIKLTSHSQTGAVIFWGVERKCLVLPPFPVAEKLLAKNLATEQLGLLLKRDYLIALILVRLGAYAVGICEGERLISSKVGTANIHGRHRKGGSSAHRFERHRDKQIEYFLTRICQRAREHLEPHEKALNYIAYGGARTTIQLLQKQCPFLAKLDTHALPPLLDIPEPRQAVLETTISRVWSSTVMEWIED